MEKIHHVFISSTFADLEDERKSVSDMIAKAGFVAEGMEIFPATSQSQMDFITKIIDRCDYYVLILAGRYGSMDDSGISYTEQEYRYAIKRGIPILAFRYKDLGKLPNEYVDNDRSKIDEFHEQVSHGAVVDFWLERNELAAKAIAALSQEKNFHPGVGWVRGDSIATEDLLKEINNLRKENDALQAKNDALELLGRDLLNEGGKLSISAERLLIDFSVEEGPITNYFAEGGDSLYVGDELLYENTVNREKAELLSAIDELFDKNFIELVSPTNPVLSRLTHKGYLEADRIRLDKKP